MQALRHGQSVIDVSKAFNIPRRTLFRWRKRELEKIAAGEGGESSELEKLAMGEGSGSANWDPGQWANLS